MAMATETAEAVNSTTRKLNNQIKQKQVFDPRIIEEDGSNKAIWNSESVELALNGLREGYKLKENPFLKTVQGALLRKAGLPFKYTQDELEVLKRCYINKFFFADNFSKLKDGDNGWSNITLRPYQRDLMKRYSDNRWNIIMFPRQSGKTTTTVIEIVQYAISNIDKDIVVIAQSEKVVNETLTKIKECFAGLPFFMQPGFISFNKKGFVLDNGCRLSIGIASESVVQGFSLDLLYIDEFAYIKSSMVDKFWNNVYPTLINNPKSRCIITSTPNGRNKFYDLWTAAENKYNKFIPYRIYWYDVPGRDEQFKRDTIANIGIEGWEMGFECSFDTQLKSIFATTVQKQLRIMQTENRELWSRSNHPFGNIFDMEFISQDAIKYDFNKDHFLLGIDIAEGLDQDASIMKLKKIEYDKEKKRLKYISVGIYRNNEIAVEDFAEHCMRFSMLFGRGKLRVVVENNSYGGEFFNQIDNLRKYEQKYFGFDPTVFAMFNRASKDDYERGIRWDGTNKKVAVKSFSNLIVSGIMEESHYLSIEEYLNFGRAKNDTFKAQYGHDDLVMADVSISHFIKSNNIYAKSFLSDILTNFINTYDIETIERRKAEEKKKASVYEFNGFRQRNHQQEQEKVEHDEAGFCYL